MNRKKITVVVPIRKGSQRILNKNFKPFAGKNLLAIKLDTLTKINVIDEIIIVSDQEMKKSMKFMFEYFKLPLEPACVAGIAALSGALKNKLQNQNTLIILCGSNIDMKTWVDLTKDQ